jgi:signal transduction histidine kinase
LEASETGQRPTLRVVVEGQSRLLDPIVGDDVYFVAREALRNALRHGRAAEIEIELTFSRASFSMRIRDNGAGLIPRYFAKDAASVIGGFPECANERKSWVPSYESGVSKPQVPR